MNRRRFPPRFSLFIGLLGLLICVIILTASTALASSGKIREFPIPTAYTVTNCDDSGPGSLRDTLASTASGSTITFSLSCDIKLNSTLTISTNGIRLDGHGQQVTLDGQHAVGVLLVNPGITFTLNALTIANGFTSGGGSGLFIVDNGKVTITNSTFTNNSTSGEGGGLFDQRSSTVSISNSTFTNNSASSGGGFDSHAGGSLTITNSTFAHNSADNGGGLLNVGTMAIISNSTFTNNSATGDVLGGGDGGGLLGGTMTISNSTFVNNSAIRYGGGLYDFAGTMTISNSTIANNSASSGGGLRNISTVSIGGSIVANNTGGNCAGAFSSDQGYNLSSDGSCGFTGTGSLQNTDPKLGPLARNGGPTQTMALLKGSPAIDYIPLASGVCPTTDQRGHKRPDGVNEIACDIGAYES